MGKVSKARTAPKPVVEISPEVAGKVTTLKSEGNKAFTRRDYIKALEQYEQAAKLLPEGAGDRVELHNYKAACFYQLRRFKDAARESTNALALAPANAKALQRRARALEQQGLYKQALSDIQAVNKSDAATDESRDTERRLRDALAGRRPAGLGGTGLAGANGARASPPAAAPAAQQQAQQAQQAQQQRGPVAVAAKCTLGDDTRVLHLTGAATYAQLLDAVHAKFPEAGPFMLKYTDRDGDAVTLTSRVDVRAAVADAVAAAPAPKGGLAPMAPSLKITCVPCSAAEVPPPPPEEAAQLEAIKRHQEAAAARAAALKEGADAAAADAAAAAVAAAGAGADEAAAGEVVEIDDWLVDFANLFREVSGLEPDAGAEFGAQGWDAAARAMEATLRAEKAGPLLEAAADKFREVTCSGLLNWGNVSVCIAHKLLDGVAEAEKELDAATVAKVTEAFDKAEERYRQALSFHPAYFDGLCALGQLEFERAKLTARLVVKPVPPPPASDDADAGAASPEAEKAAADAATAAQAGALREALTRVKPADVDAAAPYLEKAAEWYKQATAAAEAADAKRKAEQDARAAARGRQQDGASASASASGAANGGAAGGKEKDAATEKDAAATYAGQTRIMEGNTLYEWSQLLAAAGRDWRPVLDQAVALFRAAACTDADVRGALKNHTRAAELDLGPEPEAEGGADGAEK